MPSPYKPSHAAEELARRKSRKHPARWIVTGVFAVVLIAAGIAVYLSRGREEQTAQAPLPAEEKITSIAVLPFDDLSDEQDQEYFCEGLTDALIDALTKVKDLERVIPRNSVYVFQGEYHDIRSIGDSLDVDSILEGSVVKSGETLRVTVQLVKTADNSHFFSDKYEYDLTDKLKLFDEITFDVVNALKVTLVGKEREAILRRYTQNDRAFDLYMRGRFYWQKRSTEDFRTALNYFNEAIALDPGYALAYAGIADVYNLMGLHGDIPAKEAFPLAKVHAGRALEFDDTLAEAYNSLAYATLYNDWDWDEAERLFKRALELDPYYYLTHWWYKDYLLIVGRGAEARDDIERALERDPLNKYLYLGLVTIHFSLNACDELSDVITRVTRIFPEDKRLISYYNGMFYLCTGEYEKALEICQRLDETGRGYRLGIACAKAGKKREARAILQHIQETDTKGSMSNEMQIAGLYTVLGEHDKAFDVLNALYERHYYDLPSVTVWPWYEDLRSDPRYEELMKKMNLPIE